MIKAIVTVETKKTWYDWDYIEVNKFTYTAEDKYRLMSMVYRNHCRGFEKIKIEIVKEKEN